MVSQDHSCRCPPLQFDSLRPRQNGRHIADDIFKCISFFENVWIPIKFHWSLFPRVQLTIFQHWFRSWLDSAQATSHYLKQWWLVYRFIHASLGLNDFTGILRWKQMSGYYFDQKIYCNTCPPKKASQIFISTYPFWPLYNRLEQV